MKFEHDFFHVHEFIEGLVSLDFGGFGLSEKFVFVFFEYFMFFQYAAILLLKFSFQGINSVGFTITFENR